MSGDLLALETERATGEPMLKPVMRAGKRLPGLGTLTDARQRCQAELGRLADPLRSLEPAPPYPVRVSDRLKELADEVDRGHGPAVAG
jgi:nicotinate phosphoribosyltransferase